MNFGLQTETFKLFSFLPSRHKDPSLLPQAVCEIQPCCIFAHRSSSDHFYNLCIAAQFMMWTALLLPSISLSSFPIFIKNNLILSGCVPTLRRTCQWESLWGRRSNSRVVDNCGPQAEGLLNEGKKNRICGGFWLPVFVVTSDLWRVGVYVLHVCIKEECMIFWGLNPCCLFVCVSAVVSLQL